MTRTKVLLSVAEDDLHEIDRQALIAGMNRSEYLVSVGRLGVGFTSLHSTITELRKQLNQVLQSAEKVWREDLHRAEKRAAAVQAELDRTNEDLGAKNQELFMQREEIKDLRKAIREATKHLRMVLENPTLKPLLDQHDVPAARLRVAVKTLDDV